MIPHIDIIYNEGNKDNIGYKSVDLYTNKDKVIHFNSGNFVKDWFNCKRFIAFELECEGVSMSSSVDHFIMDGAPYDSAYLHIENDIPILKYMNSVPTGDEFSKLEICGNGWEFFVEKGTTPTWEELKSICEYKSIE